MALGQRRTYTAVPNTTCYLSDLGSGLDNRFAQQCISLLRRHAGLSLADRHAGARRLCAEQGRSLFTLFRRRGRAPQDSRDARDARLRCRRAAAAMAADRQHAREAADAAMDDSSREASPVRALCAPRSEEHTSELQSLMRISYAVFCLKK